jgi:uncharacterized protein YqiB (DUF1249 family)
MEKREYESLAWIHKVREENYARTKNLSPKDLIEKTRQATEQTAKALGLKILQVKERARTR